MRIESIKMAEQQTTAKVPTPPTHSHTWIIIIFLFLALSLSINRTLNKATFCLIPWGAANMWGVKRKSTANCSRQLTIHNSQFTFDASIGEILLYESTPSRSWTNLFHAIIDFHVYSKKNIWNVIRYFFVVVEIHCLLSMEMEVWNLVFALEWCYFPTINTIISQILCWLCIEHCIKLHMESFIVDVYER